MENLKNDVRQSKYPMIDMEKAFDLLIDHCQQFKPTTISLAIDKCLGHSLSEDIFAVDDMPPFRASVMDGYAIKHSETTKFQLIH
jgi:gephyrin